MNLGLKERLALVTGSTQGIGRSIAQTLVENEARVIVNGRSENHLKSTLEELSGLGEVQGVVADVSSASGVEKLLNKVSEIGDLDILVNNVSVFEVKAFWEISDQEWVDYLETNLLAGVRLCRQLLPGMIQRDWGRVVFISSESGVQLDANMLHYSVTKTAQIGLARGLAELTRGTGVTVNSVLPGPTLTEGLESFMKEIAENRDTTVEQLQEEFVAQERPSSLTLRFAQPEEVANLVAFLCSARASSINGAPCRVDGGVIRACT